MEENINWNDYTNSEIETKLKELEFEHKKVQEDIAKKYNEMNFLNTNYIKGVETLNKRTKNFKYK